MYNRRCRGGTLVEARERAAKGEAFVIRMKTPLEGEFVYKDRLRKQPTVKAWKDIDDQVLLKSDGWPTYHLAAVVDDHLMKITHVIRAEEWLNSLPKHIWLNEKLGFTAPEYVHVGLLRNADKSKISKRKNPTSLRWYEAQGYLPEALLNFLALLGHSHPDGKEKFGLDEMCGFFDLDRINVAGPVFDMQKLRHLQGQYFRDLTNERIKAEIHRAIDSRFEALLPLVKERMAFGGDFVWQSEPFYADTVSAHMEDLVPKGLDKVQAKHLLEETQQTLKRYVAGDNYVWDAPSLDALVRKLIEDRTAPGALPDATPEQQAEAKLWTTKSLFMVLRVAATGKRESPPLFDTLAQLGQAKVLERLGFAQQKLR
jgi:glutamyl-tRNA synthetase